MHQRSRYSKLPQNVYHLLSVTYRAICVDLEHTFKLSKDEPFKDIGRTRYFALGFGDVIDPSRGFLHPCSHPAPGVLGCLHLGVRAETVFSPRAVPRGLTSKGATGMVGLSNLGATCYLNALLQMLYHLPALCRAVYAMPQEAGASAGGPSEAYSLTFALQLVFRSLQCDAREVSTEALMRCVRALR